MLLKTLSLQNFRTYKKSFFDFTRTNIIIGRNTIGKTNILESVSYLSTGKSFRAQNDEDLIKTGEEFAKIDGEIFDDEDKTKLTTILHLKNNHLYKKYLVNNVPKRLFDFVSKILTVLFTPQDLEIITDSPYLRRRYIDTILLQADSRYRLSLSVYEKALKQRNKMLYLIKEGKRTPAKQEFEYWDNLLIENGAIITQERNQFVEYINSCEKKIFDFHVFYDKSAITRERLDKYFEVEQKTGITLTGPQRDDFIFYFPNPNPSLSLRVSPKADEAIPDYRQTGLGDHHIANASRDDKEARTIKEFGSRGEQRLTIFQMKMLEIDFLREKTGKNPILLLDDIFSELDNENIQKVLQLINQGQTIITTTHKEFMPKEIKNEVNIIEL